MCRHRQRSAATHEGIVELVVVVCAKLTGNNVAHFLDDGRVECGCKTTGRRKGRWALACWQALRVLHTL